MPAPRFASNSAKDWIRDAVDLPAISATAEQLRKVGFPIGYVGTPGPDLLDVRSWSGELEYVLASEIRERSLRDMNFNARRLPEDLVFRSTEVPIDDVLARAGSGDDLYAQLPGLPPIINHDIYHNPVDPTAGFTTDNSFVNGVRAYLKAANKAGLPSILLVFSTTLRGKSSVYSSTIQQILDEIREYGVSVPSSTEQALLKGGMPKKMQICVPYWLTRLAATSEGFGVDVVESLDYPGTNQKMMHLVLKFRRRAEQAHAREQSLVRLVNFGHQQVQAQRNGFTRMASKGPILGGTT